MLSVHVPWEPHTNRGGIFLCILLYLSKHFFMTSCDQGLVFYYTIPIGTLLERNTPHNNKGVTVITNIILDGWELLWMVGGGTP